MKNYTWITISLILFASCAENSNQNYSANGKNKTVIDFIVVQAHPLDRVINIPGTIIPFEMVDLYSEVTGRVERILFQEGEQVKKGQPLLQIDTDILRAELNQLKVELKFAEKEEQRKTSLYQNKAGTYEEMELAQAKTETLKARIHLLETQLDKGTIRAPFNGQIGLRQISEGAYVTPTTPLVKITQVDRVKIEFGVAQRYANLVEVGQTISLKSSVDTIRRSAKIYAFEPSVGSETRMLKIRAVLNDNQQLKPGSFVQVEYNLGQINEALMIPTSALVPVLNGQQIWLKKNGKATARLVEPGIRTSTEVQVTGEIKTGDTVVTTGLLGIREGMLLTGKMNP